MRGLKLLDLFLNFNLVQPVFCHLWLCVCYPLCKKTVWVLAGIFLRSDMVTADEGDQNNAKLVIQWKLLLLFILIFISLFFYSTMFFNEMKIRRWTDHLKKFTNAIVLFEDHFNTRKRKQKNIFQQLYASTNWSAMNKFQWMDTMNE